MDLGDALIDRLLAFSLALRRSGIPVTQAETLDAVHALGSIGLARREEVREALAAVSLTAGHQRDTFDALFDLFLPVRPSSSEELDAATPTAGADEEGAGGEPSEDEGRSGSSDPHEDPEAFLEELIRRLLEGDERELQRIAREAVDRFGRIPGQAAGGGGWFRYRVMRVVDPARILAELLRRSGEGEQPASPLEERLVRDELEARLARLQQEIDAEIRRRAAADRDPSTIARSSVPVALEELDLLHLSPRQQQELRASIRPLAHRLAARAAVRRRRGHDGRLDMRRTVRASLTTGGVPFTPVLRPRRPHRPELFVLCDVSGSVATFARFTLMLVHTMQEQFSGVRSFAFVDALDEVTHLFEGEDVEVAVARLMQEAAVVWSDGHSDYGRSLATFVERHGAEVTSRSTVVILGDARTNYRPPGTWAVEQLQRRARRVWWLNPEPRSAWDTGDSVATSYARFVEEMVEVRNLRQLAAFVGQVA